MPKIIADRISRTYRSGKGTDVRALDDVSLSISESGMTAIVGPSGSGKSTLLQCLSGLDLPDEGAVTLLGVDLRTSGEAEISRIYRERVGFVFQQYNLVESLSAFDNVVLPQRLAKKTVSEKETRAWFERLGLQSKTGHLPSQLSGGEQQRVALIRALLKRPEVVFADEPTGALDSSNGLLVLDILHAHAQQGVAVVMVTHDVAAASRADKVVVLRDGRTVRELDAPGPAAILDALSNVPGGRTS